MNLNKNEIERLLDVKIHPENFKYYTTNHNVWKSYELHEMFPNIKTYDYYSAVQKLADYYFEVDEYKELVKKVTPFKKKTMQKQISNNAPEYVEWMLMEYLKCRKDTKILIVPVSKSKPKFKTLYYTKSFQLSEKTMFSLLFNLFNPIENLNRDKLMYYQQKMENKITVYFYEGDVTMNENSYLESINFYHAVEMAKVLLHKGTMEMVGDQLTDNLLGPKFIKSRVMLDAFKLWIYQNLKPVDFGRILLRGSGTLYAYGLRDMNDIDFYLYIFSSRNFNENRGRVFRGNRELEFIDYLDQATGLEKVRRHIFDAQEYFYYNGLKVISLDINLEYRRGYIEAPRSIADMIAVNILLDKDYPIPNKEYNQKFRKTVAWALRTRYGIDLNKTQILNFLSI